MVRRERRTSMAALAGLAALLIAAGAGATEWCGENGVVRFSFADGDSLITVLEQEPENGVTMVDLYAWLTDVEPVARRGDAFLRVGGVELKLTIEGADGFIVEQEFPSQVLNVGGAVGSIAAGYVPGQRLRDGQALLVRWKIMFQGRPENVRFGLDPAGLISCDGLPGCADSGPLAVYVGIEGNNQLDAMFGAGYAPSWLNPTGEPDTEPVTGSQGWREAGVFQAR